ncbi:hypothetical protein FIBSPDRAFT_920120 [Athelia psychrophila]|uniref:Actin cytoskeleton organization protein n=1 Tax=Athelia psychrophila TaxID=1759441 RepID=A0A166I372_9AGAM|nr:hypothetical protein FIBSPDRAFT_920120 [Fibularhizoctonia sp. CBS 109695]
MSAAAAQALDRQIRPIYDSLETGSPKTAIVSCNKLLKKHPKNSLIKALKALALVRLQRAEDAITVCDEVLADNTTDDATLSAMQHVLRGLGRHNDMITMFENAYKQQPGNEELAAQTFFANVRTGNWKAAQQVATKMHKQFREDRYLYWAVISTVLQANDASTAPAMRNLLYKLANRLIATSPSPTHLSSDRFHLHISILRELELYDEAHRLLDSDIGKHICATSLLCNEVRRDIWRQKGLLKEEAAMALTRVENDDRNWLEFLSILDGTFSDVTVPEGTEVDEAAKSQCSEAIATTREFMEKIAEKDKTGDRSGVLALLELEKRARANGLSSDESAMVGLMERYFHLVGDKACCYEDMKPYISLPEADLPRWTSFLESIPVSSSSISEYRRSINVDLLLRYTLSPAELTAEAELARGHKHLAQYLEGLKLGASLPSTELQPADDLAILAAQVFVNVWKISEDEAHLYNAASILEFGLTKSTQCFQMRLLLIRIYTFLGAPSLALDHYRAMGVKNVQNDTLSHFILSRASTFSLAAIGDITYSSECIESSQIYMTNSQETSDFIVRAFTAEKYSQIPDFIVFEDRLDNSLARDAVKVEHVRMRIAHEQINADLIDLELVELKFIFNRFHHDNRDFDIIPNFQPQCTASFGQQTLLFEKSTGLGWLSAFLKIYINVLQQASDLDDTVEDKLLVGDRPKQSNDPDNKLPWNERLAKRTQEEMDELTLDEKSLLDYVSALSDWLEPHHNHVRPSPAAVLAEATKNSAGAKTVVASGNGHAKKDEEAPTIKDAPESVTGFFTSMQARLQDVLATNRPSSEALHVATLTQEAFVMFHIETLRFKPAAIAKVHKLGPLVQRFKTMRAQAAEILREMSTELLKISENAGGIEARKVFVDACEPITDSELIDHDFVLEVAKKVTDARKKVHEGIGKGLAKICTTYA